jgi:hypothetical protein
MKVDKLANNANVLLVISLRSWRTQFANSVDEIWPSLWMSSSRVVRANAVVATVLGSIPASSDSVESEGRQLKQC